MLQSPGLRLTSERAGRNHITDLLHASRELSAGSCLR
jgi:hypothetical protein